MQHKHTTHLRHSVYVLLSNWKFSSVS